jgi:hypothetical protein
MPDMFSSAQQLQSLLKCASDELSHVSIMNCKGLWQDQVLLLRVIVSKPSHIKQLLFFNSLGRSVLASSDLRSLEELGFLEQES